MLLVTVSGGEFYAEVDYVLICLECLDGAEKTLTLQLGLSPFLSPRAHGPDRFARF